VVGNPAPNRHERAVGYRETIHLGESRRSVLVAVTWGVLEECGMGIAEIFADEYAGHFDRGLP